MSILVSEGTAKVLIKAFFTTVAIVILGLAALYFLFSKKVVQAKYSTDERTDVEVVIPKSGNE